MEEYALNKLQAIFHAFREQPEEYPDLYFVRSKCIVAALKKKYPYENDFKHAFWHILWNLKLKGERSRTTLNDLFTGRWNNATEFIDASDDDLDITCAEYRRKTRFLMFERLENTKRFMQSLGETCNSSSTDENADARNNSGSNVGLICPRCKSNNTDYSFLQIRSGDEGSTAFSHCSNCQYRWKFL